MEKGSGASVTNTRCPGLGGQWAWEGSGILGRGNGSAGPGIHRCEGRAVEVVGGGHESCQQILKGLSGQQRERWFWAALKVQKLV